MSTTNYKVTYAYPGSEITETFAIPDWVLQAHDDWCDEQGEFRDYNEADDPFDEYLIQMLTEERDGATLVGFTIAEE
ncbi:MAG: hypothetical protein WA532_11450 [Candidatus Korobacteraceae bacterium]